MLPGSPPRFPEAARAAHISGPVTLQAIVAKDGSVKTINTVSGDPQLAAAARQAVSQWQFKPYTQQGRPAEFQTNVTVNFRLPEQFSALSHPQAGKMGVRQM
ncbi:MAG TPA: energy transducer TonB [Terriglobales bacterium]